MELSQEMESAARNVKELTGQQTGHTDTVHKVTANPPHSRCCYRCGKTGHMPLPASLETQSVINVEKLVICKKFVKVRQRNSKLISLPRSKYKQ